MSRGYKRNVRLLRGSIPPEVTLTYTAQGELCHTPPGDLNETPKKRRRKTSSLDDWWNIDSDDDHNKNGNEQK